MTEPGTASVARTRAETYGFLCSLYSTPPSGALIDLLRGGGIVRELGLDPDGPAARELAEFVGRAATPEDLARDLTAEHTRLFVLPIGLRPYESVFVGGRQRLGGAVTISVRRFYERAGATVLPACLDLPDHIGVEMEFMKFLCGVQADASEKGLHDAAQRSVELQKAFLEEHLLRWAPALCARLRAEATSGLFRALAHWTEEFLRDEADGLQGSGAG